MLKHLIIGVVLLTVVLPSRTIRAEQALQFAMWGPNNAPLNMAIASYADEVNNMGDIEGLKIETHWNTLGNAGTVLDNLESGVADLAWILHGVYSDRFVLTSVLELPGLFDSARSASSALWNIYEKGLLSTEYQTIIPLAFLALSSNHLHTQAPVQSISDIQGTRIRASSSAIADIVRDMEGIPVALAWTEIADSLSKGIIDGTVSPWNGFRGAGLDAVTNYHVDLDIGRITGMIAINRRVFENLSTADKNELIRIGGFNFSRYLGEKADEDRERNRSEVLTDPRHKLVNFGDSEDKKYSSLSEMATQRWLDNDTNKIDILAYLKSLPR